MENIGTKNWNISKVGVTILGRKVLIQNAVGEKVNLSDYSKFK